MSEAVNLPTIGPKDSPTEESVTVAVADNTGFSAKPFAPLVGFMDIGESELTGKTQDILNDIWEYLGADAETTVDRLYALRQLENRLSPPKLGQSRLHRIHGYIQAQRAVQKMEKMRDSYLKEIKE